jgi:hypothetical protein
MLALSGIGVLLYAKAGSVDEGEIMDIKMVSFFIQIKISGIIKRTI